jgi:hypothetical protein
VFTLKDKVMKLDKESFWLAASDIACNKKFVWCSGEEVVLANYQWAPLQPNYGPDQDCLCQYIEYGGLVAIRGFIDLECAKMARYFCK